MSSNFEDENLRITQARLAAIIESSDDAIVSKTLQGIIRTWNNSAERIFGWTADEVIGKPITIIIPPDRQHEEIQILENLRAGKRVDHFETVRLHKNGSLIHVAVTISPIRDASGTIVGASKVARDIGMLKAAEEERASLLERERALRREAERGGRLKDEFLATLSHELRTPLTAILGYAQLLKSGKLPPAEMIDAVEVIERNARAQTQIIEELLDLSRIISGKIRLDVQRTDISAVVRASLDAVRPSAEVKGVRIIAIIDPLVGSIHGDPSRLQQVLWNLLTNAIKFTGKTGKIEVALGRVNSHVEIAVADTGEGISPEFLPHVFDRFRQADSSSTRKHTGLGIGLSIVKQLVELHGGNVRAKSPGVGKGSTFVVSLPLLATTEDEPETKRVHPKPPSQPTDDACDGVDLAGIHVLVVDDEPDARRLITRILETCHAQVSSASDVDEAVALLERQTPDVIISDLGMPVKDGYDLIRAVRALPQERGGRVPAAALSAFARSEDRRHAMMSGYQTHVAKPVEPAELLAVVASLAGRINRAAS